MISEISSFGGYACTLAKIFFTRAVTTFTTTWPPLHGPWSPLEIFRVTVCRDKLTSWNLDFSLGQSSSAQANMHALFHKLAIWEWFAFFSYFLRYNVTCKQRFLFRWGRLKKQCLLLFQFFCQLIQGFFSGFATQLIIFCLVHCVIMSCNIAHFHHTNAALANYTNRIVFIFNKKILQRPLLFKYTSLFCNFSFLCVLGSWCSHCDI